MNNEIAPEEMETESKWDETPYCFICSRCTCHIGEHEDEVAAGLAEYREGLYVDWRKGVTTNKLRHGEPQTEGKDFSRGSCKPAGDVIHWIQRGKVPF